MLSELLAKTATRLPGETPALDAQVLMAHILGQNRTWVLAHPEARLTAPQEAALEAAIHQLADGLPLPYLLGRREFFGLDFEVTPDVLIPRPETELLVETALHWIRGHATGEQGFLTGEGLWEPAHRFLDIGTGSGCIAVSLAVHSPDARITATDISAQALQVARRNAERNGVQARIDFVECDLLPETMDDGSQAIKADGVMPTDLWSNVDLIVANLPYIPSKTLKELAVYQHEPALALDGGTDGLALIRRLLERLMGKMEAGRLILLEIEAGQGRAAQALAEAAFPAAAVEVRKDLAGLDRLVMIET